MGNKENSVNYYFLIYLKKSTRFVNFLIIDILWNAYENLSISISRTRLMCFLYLYFYIYKFNLVWIYCNRRQFGSVRVLVEQQRRRAPRAEPQPRAVAVELLRVLQRAQRGRAREHRAHRVQPAALRARRAAGTYKYYKLVTLMHVSFVNVVFCRLWIYQVA